MIKLKASLGVGKNLFMQTIATLHKPSGENQHSSKLVYIFFYTMPVAEELCHLLLAAPQLGAASANRKLNLLKCFGNHYSLLLVLRAVVSKRELRQHRSARLLSTMPWCAAPLSPALWPSNEIPLSKNGVSDT